MTNNSNKITKMNKRNNVRTLTEKEELNISRSNKRSNRKANKLDDKRQEWS